jgi:hypothetical protein
VGNKEEYIVNISPSLVQGVIYEHLFVAEALSKEMVPAQPAVAMPWDYLVTRLDNLDTLRIQVKGTKTPMKNYNTTRFQITAKTGTKKTEMVDARVVDVLCCYVEPYKCWYNIPMQSLKGKAVWLYPGNNSSNGQYECWRHDWSVFRT